MLNYRLISILLIIFIDIVGFGFVLPLLPFYAINFKANATVIGLLFASYSLAQTVAVPIFGKLSDIYGRKFALILSTIGDCIGFLLFGLAINIYMLFAGRIISGLTGSNLAVAQAYISDITDEEYRTKAFGMIGAAFGFGFIVGPALGGALSTFGISTPAFAAAILSFLNLISIYLFLPETLNKQCKTESEREKEAFFGIKIIMNDRKLKALFLIDIVFGFAFIIFQATFSLFSQYRFGLGPQAIGYIFAYIGALVIFVQGYLVGKLNSIFHERILIFAATIIMALSLLGWAFSFNIVTLLLILIPLSISGGIYDVITSSMISKSVDRKNAGVVLGLSSSFETLSRVIAPILGGFLFQFWGTSAPGIFGTILTVSIIIFITKARWVTECK